MTSTRFNAYKMKAIWEMKVINMSVDRMWLPNVLTKNLLHEFHINMAL